MNEVNFLGYLLFFEALFLALLFRMLNIEYDILPIFIGFFGGTLAIE